MSRSDPQFNLRIPAELRDKVAEAASENRRSATAEIIARLEESFQSPIGLPDTTADQMKNVLESQQRLNSAMESILRQLDSRPIKKRD
tara:strand:- start:12715 stop:12978 length:264 start_codon:yes stop_codon:yes gene_type:complete